MFLFELPAFVFIKRRTIEWPTVQVLFSFSSISEVLFPFWSETSKFLPPFLTDKRMSKKNKRCWYLHTRPLKIMNSCSVLSRFITLESTSRFCLCFTDLPNVWLFQLSAEDAIFLAFLKEQMQCDTIVLRCPTWLQCWLASYFCFSWINFCKINLIKTWIACSASDS